LLSVGDRRIWHRQAEVDEIVRRGLGLNLAWTPLFFGYKRVRLALADIGLLTGVVGALTVASFKVDKTAGFIYSAYLAWLGFATYLNAGVWYLNDKPSGDERGGSKDIPKAK